MFKGIARLGKQAPASAASGLSFADRAVSELGGWRFRALEVLWPVFLFLGAFVFVMGGLGTVPLIALMGLCALVLLHPALIPYYRLPELTIWTLLVPVWGGISLLWSPETRLGYWQAFALTIVIGWCALTLTPYLRVSWRPLILAGFFTASTLFILFEMVSGGAATAADRPADTPAYLVWRNLAHGMSALTVIAPIAIAYFWGRGKTGTFASMVLVLACFLGGTLTGHSANLAAFALAASVMTMCIFVPYTGFRFIQYVYAAGLALSPLLGFLGARLLDTAAQVLPISWAQRLAIWGEVAYRVPDAILFGHGFDSSRHIDATVTIRGEVLPAVPLHPHNAGLQTWYELGLIGVVIIVFGVLRFGDVFVERVDVTRRAYMAASGSVAAFCAPSLVSYGAWQPWWIATTFLAATLWRLAFGKAVRG
jgi:hypothetical protein